MPVLMPRRFKASAAAHCREVGKLYHQRAQAFDALSCGALLGEF
jgi:hypothetical protein